MQYLHNLRQNIEEAEDSVAHEVVVAVVVLVLSRQEESLAELPWVQVSDRDGARHHQENPACQDRRVKSSRWKTWPGKKKKKKRKRK